MNVVDAVRDRLALFLVRKIVRVHLAGLALGFVGLARILLVSQVFLLLGVHQNRRFPSAFSSFHSVGDVLKLPIAVGMLFAFARFAVALKTIVQSGKPFANRRSTDLITLRSKFFGPCARAFDRPSQGAHRIASRAGIDQFLQSVQKFWLLLDSRPPPGRRCR